MVDLNDVPLQVRLILHIIGIISLWLVVTYMDTLATFLSQYIDSGQIYFTPLKFIVAYVLLQYVLPRIGLFAYQQIAG